jgi:hypothetical protein
MTNLPSHAEITRFDGNNQNWPGDEREVLEREGLERERFFLPFWIRIQSESEFKTLFYYNINVIP